MKVYFLDTNIEKLLNEIVENSKNLIRLLHDRFARKLWRSLLDNIIYYYFSCMISSCPKAKNTDVKLIELYLKN